MDDIRVQRNGKDNEIIPIDPRIRINEIHSQRFIPITFAVIQAVEKHLVDLREVALSPMTILEHFKKGEMIPEF